MAHSHPAGVKLIADIIWAAGAPVGTPDYANGAPGLPNRTAYDVLRLPMYKTWAQHQANYLATVEELNLQTCTCQNRLLALNHVNVAWALLSTQPLKTGYDAQMLARPVPALNVLYKYVAQPALYEPYISLVLGRKGDREFINVQGCPRTLVWTIARLPTTFNCDINTSFWTAFASGFYDDWRYWPLAKCAVQNYWQDVINTPQYDPHPRRPMYIMLSQYAVSKNSGSFRRQLQAVPNGNQPTVGVSPELWQVVADCFHIELLVITGDQRADGRVQSYPVVPRGDHNARQVFLRREADGEYHFVRPNKPSPYEWRYTAHMHPDLLNAPKGAKLTAHNTKCNVSTAKRCPYLVTDADGVYTKPPAAIPQYHLLVAFLHVPSHVLDEAADVVNQDQTAGGAVDAYFNNGRWR